MHRPILKLFCHQANYPVVMTTNCFNIAHNTLAQKSDLHEIWIVNVLHYAPTVKFEVN